MIQRLLPFLTLIVLFVALCIATPNFLTPVNLSSVIRQTAVINIMAIGMTLIIIAGGIDLSVGSMTALTGVAGTLQMAHHHPLWVAILVGLAVGAICGFANGLMVTALKINPFIVTLGTMGIYRGLALIVSNGVAVYAPTTYKAGFSFLGDGNLFHVPFVLWVLLVCGIAMHILLEHTRLGRYAFSIGSNPEAARYAGVPITFVTICVFTIGGLLTGLAGMIQASRLVSGQPSGGVAYELTAIAAVVIGGGSLRGGEGGVVGTLVGAFIMGLLANGSDLLGTNPYWQQVLIGAVIILAVAFDELRKRRTVS